MPAPQRPTISPSTSSEAALHLPREKIGVLIANLGTPDATDYRSMRRYLSEFLSDKRVIDIPDWKWQPLLQLVILSRRPFTSGANYRLIWNKEKNESPLLTITRDQCDALREAMQARHGDGVMVEFCMRYGNPSTEAVVKRMIEAGCDRILFVPLYPQYAGATSATANDQFFRVLMQQKRQPATRTLPAYFDEPLYIEALAQSVEKAWAEAEVKPDLLVTSYHGMPRRYRDEGDPYFWQCLRTTELLRARLGWPEERIEVTFQSVFGTEEWLRPYTVERVAELAKAGKKRIAVIAPGFSADCVETLEEIQGEIAESFAHAGGEDFTYIPCLNADPAHIAALSVLIERELAGWLPG